MKCGFKCVFFLVCITLCACSLIFHKNQNLKASPCNLPKTEKARIEKATSTLPNTKEPALFVLPGVVHPENDLSNILDKFIKENPSNNIVIYIHGKGDEPSKSINDRLLAGLNVEYKLSPVMITWESGQGKFPKEEALLAGGVLETTLNELKKYKEKKADKIQGKKFTLIAHSMGSFVLEGFLEKYQSSNLPNGLLDSVLINAAASTIDNHASWVEKIDFSKQVYITYGNNDPMLMLASIGIQNARLGKHGARQNGEKERLAKNAIYVDVSQAIDEHRYFVGNGDMPCIYNFFNESLNGRIPDFMNSRIFTESIPGKDYIMNK